jgi:hypothetical protein
MVCIFSPQKQMGRPKKRRREGQVVEAAALQQNACNTIISIDEPSTYNDFGIITPPQFQESSSFVNDMGFADATTLSQHIGSMDASGLPPISDIEWVSSGTLSLPYSLSLVSNGTLLLILRYGTTASCQLQ